MQNALNFTTNGSNVFPGFPIDQPNWVPSGGASYNTVFDFNNISGQLISSASSGQLLSFTSSGILLLSVNNSYPSQLCTLQVSVKLGTATNFRVQIFEVVGGSTVIKGQTFTSLSSTAWIDVAFQFTTPPASQTFFTIALGNPDSTYPAQTNGTVYTYNWYLFTGTEISTQLAGKLQVPHGYVQAQDFIYGTLSSSLNLTLQQLSQSNQSFSGGNINASNLAVSGTATISGILTANGGISTQSNITLNGQSPSNISQLILNNNSVIKCMKDGVNWGTLDNVGNLSLGGSFQIDGTYNNNNAKIYLVNKASLQCNSTLTPDNPGVLVQTASLDTLGNFTTLGNITLHGASQTNYSQIILNNYCGLRCMQDGVFKGGLDYLGNLSLQGFLVCNDIVARALTTSGVINANAGINATTITLSSLSNYPDDATAASAGVPLNGLYRTGNIVKIRLNATAPIITLNGYAGITSVSITYGSSYTDPGGSALDYLGNILPIYLISITNTSTNAITSLNVLITGTTTVISQISSLALGTYTLRYNATDSSGVVGYATRSLTISNQISAYDLNNGYMYIQRSYNLSGDLTLECYVYLTRMHTDSFGIIDTRSPLNTNVNDVGCVVWFLEPPNGSMKYYDQATGSAADFITNSISVGVWTHIAWVRSGGIWVAYSNGIKGSNYSSTFTPLQNPTSWIVLGADSIGVARLGSSRYKFEVNYHKLKLAQKLFIHLILHQPKI